MNNISRRPDKGIIFIAGPQALTFLQGQFTCDVNACPTYGGYCNTQGRLMSFFYLSRTTWQDKEGYCLECPETLVESTLNLLKKYARFSKVTIQNISDLVDISEPTPSLQTLDEWATKDILAKIPQLTPQTQGEFLAHHLNLPELGAVSFNKGCYLGQEIIARMQYRGKIKKHLAILEYTRPADCSLVPGSPIFKANTQNEEPVGQIVNISDKLILASILDEALNDELRASEDLSVVLRTHMGE